ncbi:MAG: hypothetical protein VX589_11180 [Myxococcota bacterium]|nr:hypothetical protein [Myxococcota bacterium]
MRLMIIVCTASFGLSACMPVSTGRMAPSSPDEIHDGGMNLTAGRDSTAADDPTRDSNIAADEGGIAVQEAAGVGALIGPDPAGRDGTNEDERGANRRIDSSTAGMPEVDQHVAGHTEHGESRSNLAGRSAAPSAAAHGDQGGRVAEGGHASSDGLMAPDIAGIAMTGHAGRANHTGPGAGVADGEAGHHSPDTMSNGAGTTDQAGDDSGTSILDEAAGEAGQAQPEETAGEVHAGEDQAGGLAVAGTPDRHGGNDEADGEAMVDAVGGSGGAVFEQDSAGEASPQPDDDDPTPLMPCGFDSFNPETGEYLQRQLYTYDHFARITRIITDESGVRWVSFRTTFSNDGRTSTDTYVSKFGDVFLTTQTEYNRDFQPIRIDYSYAQPSPGPTRATYSYDDGRLTRLVVLSDAGETIKRYGYDDAGNWVLILADFPDGTTYEARYTYDERRRVIAEYIRTADGQVVRAIIGYQLSPEGKIVAEEKRNSTTGERMTLTRYIYDDEGALRRKEQFNATGTPRLTTYYLCDGL